MAVTTLPPRLAASSMDLLELFFSDRCFLMRAVLIVSRWLHVLGCEDEEVSRAVYLEQGKTQIRRQLVSARPIGASEKRKASLRGWSRVPAFASQQYGTRCG